jgi:flavin-dependent dehydrogenase
VGLGLLRSDIKNDFNIKAYLEQVLSTPGSIGDMFKESTLKSKTLGHNLTSFNKKIEISGERYLLVGDAAHLIDPIQGHGIDKAIKSGSMAAEQIIKCFKQNNFSKNTMSNYDNNVYKVLGKELIWNYKLMKMYRAFPWIITLLQPFAKLNMEFFLKLFYRK